MKWPRCSPSGPPQATGGKQDIAVNKAIIMLLDYPRRASSETWNPFIAIPAGEVTDVLTRWWGEDGYQPSKDEIFDRRM